MCECAGRPAFQCAIIPPPSLAERAGVNSAMSGNTYRASGEQVSGCAGGTPIARRVLPAGRVFLGAAVLVATVIMMSGAGAAAVAQPGHHGRENHAWAQIAAGLRHTCGIQRNHTLWCWGLNADGELGIGGSAFQDQSLPRQVSSPSRSGWTRVAAGSFFTCATRKTQTLWCWGDNLSGALGIGSDALEFLSLPQQVTTPPRARWASVTTGWQHACGIRRGGTLWCWGDNFAGELGIGNTANQDLPQQVTSPARTGWASVVPGANSTCALRANWNLWCWGDNNFGQLGIGGTTPPPPPTPACTPRSTCWPPTSASSPLW
jgi:alpha-tubulin suppressor-like RCC1 family protein